jgi:hypothetical protein
MTTQPPQPPENWGPIQHPQQPPPQPQPSQPQTPQPPRPRPSKWSPGRILAVTIVGLLVLLAIASYFGGANNGGTSPGSSETTAAVEVRTIPVDLCWSGHFQNRSVDGCGDSSVDMPPEEAVYAATAQIQGASGSLTLILRINGKQADTATTTAAYGVVSVSGTG